LKEKKMEEEKIKKNREEERGEKRNDGREK
jgi:hypothetical protein